MTSSPKISIITPSFNQAHFIKKTLDSILSQAYQHVEIIVMDGGSSDETVSILRSYGSKISFESKKDKGQTDAINKGLKHASGDIIAYLNSDDYYLPNTLLTVAKLFSNNPHIHWIVGDAVIVDEQEKEIQPLIRLFKRMWRFLYQPWLLAILNPIPQPSVFLRREVIEQIGPFDENLRYTMDYEYWIRVQQKFGKPFFLKQPLSAFRIHGASKGTTAFDKQFTEELAVSTNYFPSSILQFLHRLHIGLIKLVYSGIK